MAFAPIRRTTRSAANARPAIRPPERVTPIVLWSNAAKASVALRSSHAATVSAQNAAGMTIALNLHAASATRKPSATMDASPENVAASTTRAARMPAASKVAKPIESARKAPAVARTAHAHTNVARLRSAIPTRIAQREPVAARTAIARVIVAQISIADRTTTAEPARVVVGMAPVLRTVVRPRLLATRTPTVDPLRAAAQMEPATAHAARSPNCQQPDLGLVEMLHLPDRSWQALPWQL